MLSCQIYDMLPPLAWLIDWKDGRGLLHCGAGVETRDGAWFEGTWAGDFDAWDFAQTPDVFGSGGFCCNGRLRLVPPSHCLEPLFLKLEGTRLWASNSLAFLLAHIGGEIDLGDFSYAERFLNVLNGIDHLRFEISCLKGPIRVVYRFNVEIDETGSILYQEKPSSPCFPSYEAYVGHLGDAVSSVLANARAPARRYRLTPLSTLSKGYDSPACATLARAAGCVEAVTYVASLNREGSLQQDDCGLEIGRGLGLDVKVFRREVPLAASEADLTQFFCDGGFGGEVFWLAMAENLRGRALITGIPGGQVWSRILGEKKLFEKSDCAGFGLGEFRRTLGFAHIPLPYIAATRLADILCIGRSPAMQPWSIGGDYDRPIARRIIEEAGIAREMFGQNKSGNSFRAWYLDHWPERFRSAFLQYCKAHPISLAARLRYVLKLLRLQVLRFSCERRFLKQLAGRLSLFGNGQRFIYPILKSMSDRLHRAMRPFHPTPYKIIIRMHPRYTALLAWATANAARKYACVPPVILQANEKHTGPA